MSELADIEMSFLEPATARAREADKNLFVRFYVDAIQDEDATLAEGRPIFRSAEMVEIRVRGDRNNINVREATQLDKIRFKGIYKDFKSEAEKVSSGTPLAQWPLMSRHMVEEMKYLGFYTVEDIASASELSLSKVNGLRTYQERAKLWLEQASGGAPISRLQTENDELRKSHDQLNDLVKQLQVQIDDLKASKAKK